MTAYLSARVAAARCGVSEKTVRRWIKAGRLAADRDGAAFLVDPEQLAALVSERRGQTADNGQSADTAAAPAGGLSGSADSGAADSAAAVELVRLVRDLQQQNLELAGRVGYLQAELTQARERILALEAPKLEPAVPEPAAATEATPEPAARRWWHRVWRAVQV